jgi:CheY-like chemotaxis protein
MSKTELSGVKITQLVRSALAHLYDQAALQNHPLVAMLNLDPGLDRITRAQEVRRVLLGCVELLKPEGHTLDQAEAARAYAILTYRYVDGLSMQEIAEKLALSLRQIYREHTKGVKAVAGLVLDKIRPVDETVNHTAQERLIMAHAEVERLRQEVKAEVLDLQEVLGGVISTLSPLGNQLGLKITMSVNAPWPPVVADRVMLRQALFNLLSLALSRFVHGDLEISAALAENELLIDICETSEVTRTESVAAALPEGKVGLAVAHALLEAQDGQLGIQPDHGRWQARIRLPVSLKATVLVVDDNEAIVALFKRYLGRRNVSVVGTTQGKQALTLAAELQPQVITLDVMMPNQDGWEILQQIKQLPATQHIPVIICSVLNQPQLAHSLGASDTLVKPVSQVKLLEVLHRWLGPL